MNWSLILSFTLLLLIILFVRLRIERTRVQVANWFIVYPGLLGLFLYTFLYTEWVSLFTALLIAFSIVGVWWFAYGRHLPPVTSDTITVWGQEKAPKPDPAQLAANEAELKRLRDEKEKLEEELRALRAKQNGK